MTGTSHQRPTTAANAVQHTRQHYNRRITRDEVILQLQGLGFEHLERVPDSGSARIPARGKSPGNRSAWVSWSDDMQAVHWRDWTSDDKGTIFANSAETISPEEKRRLFNEAEIKREKAEAEKQRLQGHTAKLSCEMWAEGYASGYHSYIERKQLAELHGARIDAATGALMIPMWVSGAGLVNLQMIESNGSKRFLKNGRVKGAYSVVGSLNKAEQVLVAEGWATGASLFERHGIPTVIAFNAGNLMPVCQSIRSRFENIAVVIAADNDRQNTVNVGRKKALEAANAIGARLAMPKLCKCCRCTDHNDAIVCARRCGRG